jgi:hypothetical protein
MAREQGEGGCSALQREKWRREAGMEGREEVERRMLRSRLLRRGRKGKDGVGEIVLRDADTEMSGIARNFERRVDCAHEGFWGL